MSNPTQVDVTIMGRHFTIGTPEEEKQILLEAVALLNGKIQSIEQHGRIVETDKIAIMAALNIAHDFLKLKVGGGLEIATFQRRMKHMIEVCDEALGNTDSLFND